MSRRKYHHGDLKRALIKAALELLAEGGVQALTLRAAARAAGVSPAAPYRHYEDKAALLAAVATEGFTTLTDRLRQARASVDDPLEQLRRTAVAYVEFAAECTPHFRVMFGHELTERARFGDLVEAADAAHAELTGAIETCQAAGIIRPGDPQYLAMSAHAMVHGVASLGMAGQLGRPVDDLGEVANRLTANLFFGVSALGRPPGT